MSKINKNVEIAHILLNFCPKSNICGKMLHILNWNGMYLPISIARRVLNINNIQFLSMGIPSLFII